MGRAIHTSRIAIRTTVYSLKALLVIFGVLLSSVVFATPTLTHELTAEQWYEILEQQRLTAALSPSFSSYSLAESAELEQNYPLAYYWYLDAATQAGNADALFRIGSLFEYQHLDNSDLASSKDLVSNNDDLQQHSALFWYHLAASRHHREAKLAIQRVLKTEYDQFKFSQLTSMASDKQNALAESTPNTSGGLQEAKQTPIDAEPLSNSLLSPFAIATLFSATILGGVWMFRRKLTTAQTTPSQSITTKQDTNPHHVRVKQTESAIAKHLLQAYQSEIQQLKLTLSQVESRNKELEQQVQSTHSYATLGFQFNQPLTPAQLKQRYRQLSTLYHPDKTGNGDAMQQLNLAYSKLKQHLHP